MIDPENFTNYNRNINELQEAWLFCLVVAGKTAKTQARLLDNFINSLPNADTIFERINKAENLLHLLKESRLGQYNRLVKAFTESTKLDLKNCSLADLESIPGCGPKTARMFLVHTRPNQNVAAIDTHVLKFLKERGISVTKTTPPAGKKYREFELAFLEAAKEANMNPADFDMMIWTKYSRKAA